MRWESRNHFHHSFSPDGCRMPRKDGEKIENEARDRVSSRSMKSSSFQSSSRAISSTRSSRVIVASNVKTFLESLASPCVTQIRVDYVLGRFLSVNAFRDQRNLRALLHEKEFWRTRDSRGPIVKRNFNARLIGVRRASLKRAAWKLTISTSERQDC